MNSLPQTDSYYSLKFSAQQLASGYAPALGWQLRSITAGRYGAQVELFNPRCASLKLQGGIAAAWIDLYGGAES